MSIQAVMLSNPEGRLIFYRNYSSVSHSLFEDLAFSLPQTIKKDSQHTFAIHGQYRLIYLPIEGLFLSLVTDRNSNILEDIDSVAQMKEVISSIIGSQPDEAAILENYIDLVLAFDDMVNLKTRTAISKTQITSLLQMESNNEKMHNALQESKEKEAMRKAEEEVRKIERTKKVQDLVNKELKEIDKSIRDYSGKIGAMQEDLKEPTMKRPTADSKASDNRQDTVTSVSARKGMQLGKKPEKRNQQSGMKPHQPEDQKNRVLSEDTITDDQQKGKFNPLNEEIKLFVDEKISGEIGFSGSYSRFELKGALGLILENPELENFQIHTNNNNSMKHLNMKLPPNFDKNAWAKGVLTLKSKTASLPKRTVVETLKYALTFNSFDEVVPFNFSIWLSGPQISFEIEFNDNQSFFKTLKDISIHFRKIYGNDFSISETENSSYDTSSRYLVWKIPRLDSETTTASMIIDFEEKITEDEIFPADIQLASPSTVFDLKVSKVVDGNDREVKYLFEKNLSAKDFYIA